MFQENRMPVHRREPRQQHQRQADAVRRQVILDPQRRNPRHFDDREHFRRIEVDRSRHARGQPASAAVNSAILRAAERRQFRQQHQQQRGAQERNVDGPGKYHESSPGEESGHRQRRWVDQPHQHLRIDADHEHQPDRRRQQAALSSASGPGSPTTAHSAGPRTPSASASA